jgi:hypothetical protein
MRRHLIVAGALLFSCGFASAQKPDPIDGYWGPRDTFDQRWSVTPPQPQATPRLVAEGNNMDAPAPPETTGRAQPRNSPDPNPRPGEEPRPIPR